MLDGEIKFELYGYKLRGAFTLVHTGKGTRGQQLGPRLERLAADQEARRAGRGVPRERRAAVRRVSVLSGLTIDELAAGAPRHAARRRASSPSSARRSRAIAPGSFEPMLCQTADAPFSSDDWVFELKYDGFRMLGVRRRRPGDAALSLGRRTRPSATPS